MYVLLIIVKTCLFYLEFHCQSREHTNIVVEKNKNHNSHQLISNVGKLLFLLICTTCTIIILYFIEKKLNKWFEYDCCRQEYYNHNVIVVNYHYDTTQVAFEHNNSLYLFLI